MRPSFFAIQGCFAAAIFPKLGMSPIATALQSIIAFSENSQFTSAGKVASVICSSHAGIWNAKVDSAKLEKYLLNATRNFQIIVAEFYAVPTDWID